MVIDTSKLLSGSWRTSAAGYIFVIAGIVTANPGDFVKWPLLITISKYVMLLSGGLGLQAAKDSNVTGGSKANPTNDPNVVATTANPRGQ